MGSDEHMRRVLEVAARAQNVGEEAQQQPVGSQHSLQRVGRVFRAREEAQLPDVNIQLRTNPRGSSDYHLRSCSDFG